MEVVSPDQPERDLVEKRADYAEAGTPEYWIVDPRFDAVTVLALEGAAYVEHGVFTRGRRAESLLLEGFSVDVDTVFAAALRASIPLPSEPVFVVDTIDDHL